MSEELPLNNPSSAKITSPPDLNRITKVTADVLTSDTIIVDSEVVNSDVMAQERTVVRKRANRKRGGKGPNTSSNGDTSTKDKVIINSDSMAQGIFLAAKGRTHKTTVNRRNNSTNGDQSMPGKKLKLQQPCNILRPPAPIPPNNDDVAMDPAVSVSATVPPAPKPPNNDAVVTDPAGSVSGTVPVPAASKQPNINVVAMDPAISVSGNAPPAPKKPNNNLQNDDFMQPAVLAQTTVASTGTMSPMENSGSHLLNPETLSTPRQPKIINLDELVIAPTEKPSIVDDVTDSSLDSYTRTVFGRASCIKPFPVKLLTGKPVISISEDINAYIHLVNMTSTPCCGYCYIFRVVDPIARYGHALPMKFNSTDDMESALKRLLLIARKHPKTVYVGQYSLELLSQASHFPSLAFQQKKNCPLMEAEMKKFSKQLAIWMEENNNNNWLFGISAVQAVTNVLPLSVE